jgi:hypothetical protein
MHYVLKNLVVHFHQMVFAAPVNHARHATGCPYGLGPIAFLCFAWLHFQIDCFHYPILLPSNSNREVTEEFV